METLKIATYNLRQSQLLGGHEIDSIYTSPFEDNKYCKHYICTDGFELWEVNRVISVEREFSCTIYGVEVFKTITVKMYEHEMWTSDTGSIFSYEVIQ